MKNFIFLAFLGAAAALPTGDVHENVILPTDDVEENIFRGYPCPEHAVPYQVSLKMGYHFCGGALIRKEWVLSAAQCSNKRLRVHLGDYNSDVIEKGEQIIPAAKIISHPSYNPVTHDNDIMLIKLQRPATISSSVSTISLPTSSPPVGTQCRVSGWGNTVSHGRKYPSVLQCMDAPVLSESSCHRSHPQRISPNAFCLGFPEGGKDACEGDTGGPAVCNGELQGIVSWGKGCAQENQPNVYTKVSTYVDWINRALAQN